MEETRPPLEPRQKLKRHQTSSVSTGGDWRPRRLGTRLVSLTHRPLEYGVWADMRRCPRRECAGALGYPFSHNPAAQRQGLPRSRNVPHSRDRQEFTPSALCTPGTDKVPSGLHHLCEKTATFSSSSLASPSPQAPECMEGRAARLCSPPPGHRSPSCSPLWPSAASGHPHGGSALPFWVTQEGSKGGSEREGQGCPLPQLHGP